MTEYVALLGRINVGGHTTAMADLRSIVGELGHTDVGTYIQTGNVFFRSTNRTAAAVEAELQAHLTERLGYPVPAFVRTLAELDALAAEDPFQGIDLTKDTRHLVLLMSGPPPAGTVFPVEDTPKGFRVIGTHGRDAFLVLTLVKGRPGNAAVWVEKQFGVSATGRFAHTLGKLLDAAHQHFG